VTKRHGGKEFIVVAGELVVVTLGAAGCLETMEREKKI
jgi:hypothetical protein